MCAPSLHFESPPLRARSQFISYRNSDSNPGLRSDFSLSFIITTTGSSGAYAFNATMDTGSTGVVISAKNLNLTREYLESKEYQKGIEYLSSSQRLWEGYWINAEDVNFTFVNAPVTAKIPILAVTENSTCRDFANGSCHHKLNATCMPPGIRYLGVGFGRWNSEQPNATNDKVPFTNIAFLDGSPVDRSFHQGYIITSTGVEVGLTQQNVKRFSTTQLERNTEVQSRTEWLAVNMSLSVGYGNEYSHLNNGTALFDTGINYSFIQFDKATTKHLHTRRLNGERKVLTDNSTVFMRIGDAPDYIGSYNVTVGDENNVLRPSRGEFRVEKPNLRSGAFINTGRFFYRGFDTLFDAQNGYFGVRWKDESVETDGRQDGQARLKVQDLGHNVGIVG